MPFYLDSIFLECLVNSFSHNADILPTRQIWMKQRNLEVAFQSTSLGILLRENNEDLLFSSCTPAREKLETKGGGWSYFLINIL